MLKVGIRNSRVVARNSVRLGELIIFHSTMLPGREIMYLLEENYQPIILSTPCRVMGRKSFASSPARQTRIRNSRVPKPLIQHLCPENAWGPVHENDSDSPAIHEFLWFGNGSDRKPSWWSESRHSDPAKVKSHVSSMCSENRRTGSGITSSRIIQMVSSCEETTTYVTECP